MPICIEIEQRTAHMKQHAAQLGFDACAVAPATPIDTDDHLGQWLRSGFHASMAWMERTKTLRQDVQLKVPGARSVIVLARNYHAPRPEAAPGQGKVAAYAWGRDYHRVLKKPLRLLTEYVDTLEDGARSYASVDSGPVLERAWAARAGLAAIGKNSLALRRDLGSWFFLATIITTVEFKPGEPAADLCGSCRACLDACPTDAIVQPYVVDSNRCISYQTIENRGSVPPAIAEKHGDWVFGCDICQEVCPWNRFAAPTTEDAFHPRPGHANPDLRALNTMTQETFEAEFRGTPIMRAKWKGMQRNAAIATDNQPAPCPSSGTDSQ